ncbi:glycosyltransferase family 2 protein [Candidatus Margulisiibacteriota bacterium]
MKPLVSIIIANYNYGRFLKDAISSCLQQDYSPLEIIVVDDGSTDDSRQVISEFGDKIVPVLKNNGGQASAFNAGFKKSNGEYICLMDADDVFLPQKVSKAVEAFQKYPGAEWCFHAVECSGRYDRRAENTTNWLKRSKKEHWYVDLIVCNNLKELRKKMPFIPPTSANIYKRSLLAKILPLPEHKEMTFNDYYMHLAAFHLSKGVMLREVLTKYRVHGRNNSLHTPLRQRARNYIQLAHDLTIKYPKHKKFWGNLFLKGLVLSIITFGFNKNSYVLLKNSLTTRSGKKNNALK